MKFENNGQPESDASREDADLHDDDVLLTALALGQISDPAEINRLKELLAKDDAKKQEFESTAQLAGIIRDGVENDLPLAPGSIHDVVVAALADSVMMADRGKVQSPETGVVDHASASPEEKKGQSRKSGTITPNSSQSWWKSNTRTFAYVSTLSVLALVCSVVLLYQNLEMQPTNVAIAEKEKSGLTDNRAGSPGNQSGADEERGRSSKIETAESFSESNKDNSGDSGRWFNSSSAARSSSAIATDSVMAPSQFEKAQGLAPAQSGTSGNFSAPALPGGAGSAAAAGRSGAGFGGLSNGDAGIGQSSAGGEAKFYQLQKNGNLKSGLSENGADRSKEIDGAVKKRRNEPKTDVKKPDRQSSLGSENNRIESGSRGAPPARPDMKIRKGNEQGIGAAANTKQLFNAPKDKRNERNRPTEPKSTASQSRMRSADLELEKSPKLKSKPAPDGNSAMKSGNRDFQGDPAGTDGEAAGDDLAAGLPLSGKQKSNSEKQSQENAQEKREDNKLYLSPGEPDQLPEVAREGKTQPEMELSDSQDKIRQIDPALENNFVQPIGTNAISTFSVDTDTASYTNIRQMLRNGRLPDPENVRIEEMINYFDFKYHQPQKTEPFSVDMELASSPWSPGNKILKIGLQTRIVSNEDRPASNLVFLVDVSGSMRAKNKLPLFKSGLTKMVHQLREDDFVAIISYANHVQVRLEPTDGSQKEKILAAINGLKAGGGTNGGQGLETAYQLAAENLVKDGTNRIILGTDGDFNLGIQDDQQLAALVKQKAESGVFLTVCGFGTDNFQDRKMQLMSQNGNGKVYYIDSEKESHRVFVERISGSLVTIAKDVKLQLLFNPRTVQSYRLIGYENRMLAAEDFDNDQKDAGEMDAGDSVTALYEIVPGDGEFTVPTAVAENQLIDLKYQIVEKQKIELTEVAKTNDIAALRIRFKKPEGSKSELREFVVQNGNVTFNRASREFQLSTAVAGLGMMLRGSRHRGGLNFENLKEFGQTVLATRPGDKPENESQQAETRKQQREEVLELIDRASELYQNRQRNPK